MDTFARSVEYVNGRCYVDGVRQLTTSECDGIGIIILAIIIPLIIIALALFVWWIFTLIHVITHEDVPNRVVWLVLHFVGLSTLAAPIYYFAVQRPYNKSKASVSPPKKTQQ